MSKKKKAGKLNNGQKALELVLKFLKIIKIRSKKNAKEKEVR